MVGYGLWLTWVSDGFGGFLGFCWFARCFGWMFCVFGLIAFAGGLSWRTFCLLSGTCGFWFSGYMAGFSVWWVL